MNLTEQNVDIRMILKSWCILEEYSHIKSIYKVRQWEAYMLEELSNYLNKNTTQESTYIR